MIGYLIESKPPKNVAWALSTQYAVQKTDEILIIQITQNQN